MTHMYGRHILIVEDEEPIRNLVRFALEREDYQVLEAGTAQEGRLAIADVRPDLILMDWMLPGVSGLDFARELKSSEAFCDIPIIMLTARGEEEDKVRGLYAGCDDYMTKPFSAAELVANGRSVDEIAQVLGADRLIYQDLDALKDAVRHNQAHVEDFEDSVFSGHYVTADIDRDYLSQLELFRSDAARTEGDSPAKQVGLHNVGTG